MPRPDTVILDSNIRFRRVGDEGVVVDQRSAEVMVVSEVAIRTLELIRDTQSLERVEAAILEEYDVSDEQLKADLERFLDDLARRNMLGTEADDLR